MNLIVYTAFILPVVLAAFNYKHIPYPEYGPDIAGYAYCARRSGEQCCAGRDDHCTMPILDTYCYCDIFCNRTVSDCCPDFWELCIGIAPPEGALTPPPPPNTEIPNNCYFEGELYEPGSKLKINCNNCTCVKVDIDKEYNWKCSQDICLIREDIIKSVNAADEGWRASNYSFLWGKTLSEGIHQRLGTHKPTADVRKMTSIRINVDERLPERFDSREEWPDLIHDIMDQGDCGASFAFSTVGVASDRLSIHSHGMFRDGLSVQQIVSCDYDDQMQKGCRGGYIDRAWWFLRRIGVVTDTCYPYRSGDTNTKGQCQIRRRYYQTPVTKLGCPVGDRRSRIHQATPPYRISPNEGEIMKEIMQNGPVQATMEIKEDFYMYNNGVYQYTVPDDIMNKNHRKSGYHSVKIIGWGNDDTSGRSRKYWLAANSWGKQWGEDGYFRILRGVNECDIESFVVGAWAKVNGRQLINRLHQRRKSINSFRNGNVRPAGYGRLRRVYNQYGNNRPQGSRDPVVPIFTEPTTIRPVVSPPYEQDTIGNGADLDIQERIDFINNLDLGLPPGEQLNKVGDDSKVGHSQS